MGGIFVKGIPLEQAPVPMGPYGFFYIPGNPKLIPAGIYASGIFWSETYDSPQYSVDKSHGLSVQ